MKKPELLAPVGSFESLHAAIRAGADAIYFGVEQLNMRTKSVPTITIEDIAEIVEVCHDNGIKCYLTLNTVMYDHDMQLAARKAKEAGGDALIVVPKGKDPSPTMAEARRTLGVADTRTYGIVVKWR